MKLCVIILLGCLAVAEVSAGLFGLSESKANKSVDAKRRADLDFDGLNEHLLGELPEDEDREANLARLRQNIHQLTGGVQKAGQLLLNLVDGGAQCTSDSILSLIELQDIIQATATTRMGKLAKKGWTKARQVCESQLQQSQPEADPDMAKFLSRFKPYIDESIGQRLYEDISYERLFVQLRMLALGVPEAQFVQRKRNMVTGAVVQTKSRKGFDYAFDKLLLSPCQRVVSKDETFNNMLAMTSAEQQRLGDDKSVSIDFDEQLKMMKWTRNACSELLGWDSPAKTRFFEAIPRN